MVAELAYGSEVNNPWRLDLAQGPPSLVLASRPLTIDNGDGNANSRPYDWAISGGRVFGYGPISISRQGERQLAAPGETFEPGFFVARKSSRRSAVEDLKLIFPFDKYPFYTLGHNYIAVNNDGAYFLAMGVEPSIHLIPYMENSLRELTLAMPAGYELIPELQEIEQGEWNDTRKIYRKVESLKMPVGLYGHGEMIFLLTRAPASDGASTEWWVHRMDPRRNKITGKVRLPTSAAHLTVVAGPEEWYVFEKGPVVEAGLQEVSSLLVIPVDWLTDMDRSPLALPDIAGICASGEPAGSNHDLQLATMALGAS